METQNDNLVLICGLSAGGKSASLHLLKKPEGVLYLNCEANKKLPFPTKFVQVSITDPLQVPALIATMESKQQCHTIVVDTSTFLMDMFESMYILPKEITDTMSAWSDYAQFLKNLMQDQIAKSTKNIIFLAHVHTVLNENEMVMETKVPVKGQLAKNGIEAFFSTIIYAKKVTTTVLESYKNDLLVITPEEENLGFKYVYQTQLTKETVTERIRASMGMWNQQETFIDNNAQLVLNRLHEYYQ